MWYVFMFSGLAILLVVVVLIRNSRVKAARAGETAAPTHTAEASRTPSGSAARRERKRRRAQSRADRRKRH